MLHLALAALLVGSSAPATDRPSEGDTDRPARTEAPIGIVNQASQTDAIEEAPINLTYAFGREEATPIKFWVGYGWARTTEQYNAAGDRVALGGGAVEEIVAQRAFIGAQADFINLERFRIGVGAQLTTGSNSLTATGTNPLITDQNTGFGLQNLALFAHARGSVLGLHGGYMLDLGDDPAANDITFTSVSDRRDAIFLGATFDYPSERLRLFGGIDYFLLQENSDIAGPAGDARADVIVFNMGAGVRISWVELGAAAIIQSSLGPALPVLPTQGQSATGAGHVGSLVPYVRLSPPALPVAFSVRAGFNREYADTGFTLGGARFPASDLGFTVAATFGF